MISYLVRAAIRKPQASAVDSGHDNTPPANSPLSRSNLKDRRPATSHRKLDSVRHRHTNPTTVDTSIPSKRKAERDLQPNEALKTTKHQNSAEALNAQKISVPPKGLTAFERYNLDWSTIKSYDADIPVPNLKDMYQQDGKPFTITAKTGWPKDEIIKINAMLFYVEGFDIEVDVIRRDRPSLTVATTEDGMKVEKLAKFLKRKELPRWHPDRLNQRTGKPGVIDESIGKRADIVAVRTAVQELIGTCEDFLTKQVCNAILSKDAPDSGRAQA